MWKVMRQIINNAHLPVSVNTGQFYPLPAEDDIIRKNNPQIKSNTKKQG
jgi:hypothetical protein